MIRLSTLAPWPDDDAPQGDHDRFQLLSTVAGQLGITARRPGRREWRLAEVPADHLQALRDAVESEGERTDRRRVTVGAGHRFQTVVRHPARARTQLLGRIDRHLPAEVG